MKLENQVVNLALAKKLKSLGVKQESLFYWFETRRFTPDGMEISYEWELNYGNIRDTKTYEKLYEYISAFTVAELGDLLPRFQVWPSKANDCYNYASPVDEKFYIVEATEADARAKMLIYLIENKLI